jgi:hypothetical protein
LNFNGLGVNSARTASGELLNNAVLLNSIIGFQIDNQSAHLEGLNKIHISRPIIVNMNTIEGKQRFISQMSVPSLLGLDVLRRYNLSHNQYNVILEK